MKVLVVGGAGYVGGALTDALAKTNHEFRIYDALVYEECFLKPIDFVYGDVRDHKRLLPQLQWADAVIWLAAVVGDGACAIDPEISKEVNENSVKWLASNFKGRIIFMSTCSVYGAMDGELTEESETNPLSVYAVTKLAAEKYLLDKNAMIFRLGTLFGKGDNFSRIRFDLVVNTLTYKAYVNNKIDVFGGDQFRPLLHVRDVARACIEQLTTKNTGIFNLIRQNVRIVDLAYQVRNHFPDLVIKSTDMKFEDLRNYRASDSKTKTFLSFKPKYSIDDGIEEIKDLLVAGRIRNIDNPRYSNEKYLNTYQTHHFKKD
jgi:nucleoside-diphosphate-sugar epimerase